MGFFIAVLLTFFVFVLPSHAEPCQLPASMPSAAIPKRAQGRAQLGSSSWCCCPSFLDIIGMKVN